MNGREDPCSFIIQSLVWNARDGARQVAYQFPAFLKRNGGGCVRIAVIPLSPTADNWAGGFNSYTVNSADGTPVDAGEREFVYDIRTGGSHTILWQDPSSKLVMPVNCAGYSALKLAYAKWKHLLKLQLVRGEITQEDYDRQFRTNTPFYSETNGWARHKGAVGTTVQLNGADFAHIFVCVSGAEPREDEACALAGLYEVQTFFERYADACETTADFFPRVVAAQPPLEQTWELSWKTSVLAAVESGAGAEQALRTDHDDA